MSIGGVIDGHGSEGMAHVKDSEMVLWNFPWRQSVSDINDLRNVIQTLGQIRNRKIDARKVY